jgi:hypothetical protein
MHRGAVEQVQDLGIEEVFHPVETGQGKPLD